MHPVTCRKGLTAGLFMAVLFWASPAWANMGLGFIDVFHVFFLAFFVIVGLEGVLLRVLLDMDLRQALRLSFAFNFVTSLIGFLASFGFRSPRDSRAFAFFTIAFLVTVLLEFLLLVGMLHGIQRKEGDPRPRRWLKVLRAAVLVNVASYILLALTPAVFPEERGLFRFSEDVLAEETAVHIDP